MNMKSNDYVKFLTQTVVKYIDQPKDERKRHRIEKKDMKEPFLFRWFGMFSYLFYLGMRRKKQK